MKMDQLDAQIMMTITKIRRESDELKRRIDHWEPRPCPPDFK